MMRGDQESQGMRAAMVVAGLALGIGLLRPRRGRPRSRAEEKRRALVIYLREHLSGADAAVQVVDRLRRNQSSLEDRPLFEFLHASLRNDCDAVTALLLSLGESPRSLKRIAGYASGSLLKRIAGGSPGELSLFRTLEALAIGVQGKRCLWRALQSLEPNLSMPGRRSLSELESAAVHQWNTIEARRQFLVPSTFELAQAPQTLAAVSERLPADVPYRG